MSGTRADRIRRWHFGKLIILWVWGAFLAGLAWYWVVDLEPSSDSVAGPIGGLLALGAMLLIPGALSVVTWLWLGGRETAREESASERGVAGL